jgi:hypothetical protein
VVGSRLKEGTARLAAEINKIWLEKPLDVRHLSDVLGAFEQSGSVKIYADCETRAVADVLTRLQKVLADRLVAADALSLVAASLLEAYADQWRRYYKFREIPAVLETAVGCLKEPIRSAADLDRLLGLCVRYIYRVCFWIDTEIPWKEVTDLFREGKRKPARTRAAT